MYNRENVGAEIQDKSERLDIIFEEAQELLNSFQYPVISELKQSLYKLKIQINLYIEESQPKKRNFSYYLFFLFTWIFYFLQSLCCCHRNEKKKISLYTIEVSFNELKKDILDIDEKKIPTQEIINMIEMIRSKVSQLLSSQESMAVVLFSPKKNSLSDLNHNSFLNKTDELFERVLSELRDENLCLSNAMRKEAIKKTTELRDICKTYQPNSDDWTSSYKGKQHEIKKHFHPDLYQKEEKFNDLDSAKKLFPMFEGIFDILFKFLKHVDAGIEMNELFEDLIASHKRTGAKLDNIEVRLNNLEKIINDIKNGNYDCAKNNNIRLFSHSAPNLRTIDHDNPSKKEMSI